MPFVPPSGDVLPSPDILPGMADVGGSTGGMVFRVEITDLYGTILPWTDALGGIHSTVEQYTGLSFTLPISDDRSASLTLSVYNPAVANLPVTTEGGNVVMPLIRMVRIRFRGVTQFWGLITAPKVSTEKATVELNCQGPAFKLRHRQLNLGDDIVGTEESPIHSPSDWTTMKAIVEAAYDTTDQYAQNIPDIGITVENVSAVEAPAEFWTDIQRGDNNWDALTEVAASAYGAEFDIVPYDPAPDEIPFDTTLVEVTP